MINMINFPPSTILPIGTKWLEEMPTGLDSTPPAPLLATQPVKEFRLRNVKGHTSGKSQQVVEWLYAEVRQANVNQGTVTNPTVRTWVQQEVGKPTDDAGHIIGKRQGGLGTVLWNIFPQNKTFNRGVFSADVESVIANAASNGGGVPVRIWFRFYYENATFPGRPTKFSFFIQYPNQSTLHSDLVNPP